VAALSAVRLEAILIGNAAAAIQGAPVTTVDFDFMFRATPANLAKLKNSRHGWRRSSCARTIRCHRFTG
jgi:hypothetical protein